MGIYSRSPFGSGTSFLGESLGERLHNFIFALTFAILHAINQFVRPAEVIVGEVWP